MISVTTGFNGSGIKLSAFLTIGLISELFLILLKILSGDIFFGGRTIISGILIGRNLGGGNHLGGSGTSILFNVLIL